MDFYAQRRLTQEYNRFSTIDLGDIKIAVLSMNFLKASVNIHYTKQGNFYEFPQFPTELNERIYSFNFTSVTVIIDINYPYNYPFSYPEVILKNIKTNLNINHIHNLSNIIKTLIKDHNKYCGWECTIIAEKDIIYFASKWLLVLEKYLFP